MTAFGKNLVKISICLTCGGFYGFEFNWGFFEGFVHSEYLDREILANSVIIRLGFTLFINKLRTASLGLAMSTTWIRIQLSRLFRTDLCSAFDQDILENIQILQWKTDWAIPREIESFVWKALGNPKENTPSAIRTDTHEDLMSQGRRLRHDHARTERARRLIDKI